MRRLLRGADENPRLAQIRRLGLFATLKPAELRVIDQFLHERTYLAGEVIFDQGEEGQAIFVVLSGKVVICRQGEPDDPIAIAPEGSMFGELALLDGSPRAAQARAGDDCVLASLSRGDFHELLETHATIASKVSYQLAVELGQKLKQRFVTLADRPL